jgi:hypothetical protein
MQLVLHPRHKLEYFKQNNWDDASIEAAREIVQDEFDRSYWLLDIEGDNSTTRADRKSTVRLFFQVAKTFILNALMTCIQAPASSEQMNIFDNLMDITSTPSSDDELQRYLAADVEDVKDGLMWWHERRSIFPRLSRMARDYLSIPGECLFSCICLMY